MLITRYNYEEIFLLYSDGELSPLEVEIVEQFLQVHPDLKEELDMLVDCKLIPDMPVFFPKEKLYKQTIWDAENISETQSKLLLLLDNELSMADKKIIEKDIAGNPVLELEWNALQQTKLPVETIAHPHKQPLYKQKRIATIWWRWAAAAAIIVGAGWFLVGKNEGGTAKVFTTIAKIENGIQAPISGSSTTNPVLLNTQNAVAQEVEQPESVAPKTLAENTVAITNKHRKALQKEVRNKQIKKNQVLKEDDAKEDAEQDLAKNTSLKTEDNIDNNDERITHINPKILANIDDESHVKPQKALARFSGSTKNNLVIKNKTNQMESFAGLQADADEDEYVHIAGARVKKQKLRGVFRNITRGIGRTFSNSRVEAATLAINNE